MNTVVMSCAIMTTMVLGRPQNVVIEKQVIVKIPYEDVKFGKYLGQFPIEMALNIYNAEKNSPNIDNTVDYDKPTIGDIKFLSKNKDFSYKTPNTPNNYVPQYFNNPQSNFEMQRSYPRFGENTQNLKMPKPQNNFRNVMIVGRRNDQDLGSNEIPFLRNIIQRLYSLLNPKKPLNISKNYGHLYRVPLKNMPNNVLLKQKSISKINANRVEVQSAAERDQYLKNLLALHNLPAENSVTDFYVSNPLEMNHMLESFHKEEPLKNFKSIPLMVRFDDMTKGMPGKKQKVSRKNKSMKLKQSDQNDKPLNNLKNKSVTPLFVSRQPDIDKTENTSNIPLNNDSNDETFSPQTEKFETLDQMSLLNDPESEEAQPEDIVDDVDLNIPTTTNSPQLMLIQRIMFKKGGVSIVGPKGIATAEGGGTAIVGPNGVAYTKPNGIAIVGPGSRVVSLPIDIDLNKLVYELYKRQSKHPEKLTAEGVMGEYVFNNDGTNIKEVFLPIGSRIVATGPTIYHNFPEIENRKIV